MNAMILGNAAHPMLPFLAQGAVMAIEDRIRIGGPDRSDALEGGTEHLRNHRLPRVTRIQLGARSRKAIVAGVPAMITAAPAPSGSVSSDTTNSIDWIFDFDVISEVSAIENRDRGSAHAAGLMQSVVAFDEAGSHDAVPADRCPKRSIMSQLQPEIVEVELTEFVRLCSGDGGPPAALDE